MDVAAHLAESAARVDAFLDARLPPAAEPPEALHAAMRHLLFPGGKRLRPALAFAACQAVGSPVEAALPAAAAVELIHTYSLVHDDLPCMDDDDERRGQPTVHRRYGEATAVLAGDALQAEAFAVLSDAGPAAELLALPALRELAAAAGSRGLVGGQSDDLAFEASRASGGAGPDALAELESIHRRKTAALIRAAVVCGAVAGGVPPGDPRLSALARFGEAVGLAFQICDDRLDHSEGAAAGEGEASSYVAQAGSAAAGERAEALLREALAEIEDWGERAEPLRELARFSVRRDQ